MPHHYSKTALQYCGSEEGDGSCVSVFQIRWKTERHEVSMVLLFCSLCGLEYLQLVVN